MENTQNHDHDYEHEHHHHHHHHHTRRRRRLTVFLSCLGLSFVLVALAGGVGFAFSRILGRIDTIEEVEYIPPEEEEFETDEGVGEDTVAPEDIAWPKAPAEPKKSTGVTNILLIGQDTRVPGERARSDTMILISLNGDTEEVNMISIMRDLYVQIPGYSDNRINASYQFGGAELLDTVIEQNFGVNIDHNVEIDFTGFEQIIDDLGGVNITLTATEADYFQNQGYAVSEGFNHVYGDFALAYARTRYVSTATESDDFGRTERQRAVIDSIFQSYGNASLTEKISVLYQVLGYLSTDMTTAQMISLLSEVQGMNISEIGSYRIPVDGSYSNQVIRGMEVLVPNLEENREAIEKMIYGKKGE